MPVVHGLLEDVSAHWSRKAGRRRDKKGDEASLRLHMSVSGSKYINGECQ